MVFQSSANALQFGPSLLLGLYGGVIADGHDRRRLLMLTQARLRLLVLAVGVLPGIGRLRVRRGVCTASFAPSRLTRSHRDRIFPTPPGDAAQWP